MQVKGVLPGNVGNCFQEAVTEVSDHPRTDEMTCFTIITVIPKAGTKDDHDVMITCVGSQHDQLGMLATMVRHLMGAMKLQKDLVQPDPLEKAPNKEELEALVNKILAKVKPE